MEGDTVKVPANELPFEELCELFEELWKLNHTPKKSREAQYKIIENFIYKFRINAAKVEGKKNCTFFPILRLLLPDLERERGAYNLKESKVGQLLVKVLALPMNSNDARKLLNFRSVSHTQEGDLPCVAYYVLKTRIRGAGNVTVQDINDALDKISNAVGRKSEILDDVFSNMLMKTTAKQQMWFLRIILKNLKLGIGRNRILAAFHPDAPEYFESCGNLLKVCEELDDGNTRPPELGIQLFSAVSPMLSERLDVMNIGKLPDNKTYQIENKFDGERFQIHMENGIYEYFSRRGFSYSDKYGKTYESDGFLTPFLKESFNPETKSFILDGEMMGWHKERNCFGSKGMSFDVKKITSNSKFQPCFCAFDILYYNGKSLVGTQDKGGLPLNERLKILDNLFVDIPGVIYHSERKMVEARSDIVHALNTAITQGDEGIVVKETDSYYMVNKRNAGWYKVKPEYTEGAMVDLDLVIVGGDYAENKKQGLVRSFLVAVADRSVPGELPQRWLAVGRVSTGLTFEEKERICTLLEPHWQRYTKSPIPDCLVFNKEKPELWILPEKSIVVEVRATELIRSKEFATDYTLRFPRIVKIRDDKPVNDILTLEEFNELVKDKTSVIKLNAGHVNPDDVQLITSGIRFRRKRQAKTLEVADQFKAATIAAEVTPKSRALYGRKLCVLSDDEDFKKPELESLIKLHSGIVVQNITSDTWCCVAGRKNVRVNNALENLKTDIVSTAWLRSLPEMDEPCPLPVPLDMVAITRMTRLRLARDYDTYGDSYTELINEATLKKCFDKMDVDMEPKLYLTVDEMLKADMELFGEVSPYSYLRCCFINFPDNGHRLAIKAEMCGAILCDATSPYLTHVIVTSQNKQSNSTDSTRKTGVLCVTENWLEACFLNKKRMSEKEFIV